MQNSYTWVFKIPTLDVFELNKSFINKVSQQYSVILLKADGLQLDKSYSSISCKTLDSFQAFHRLHEKLDTPYFVMLNPAVYTPESLALTERMCATQTLLEKDFAYGNAINPKNGLTPIENIAYQKGSLRNDFDFGPVSCISSAALDSLLKQSELQLEHGAFYALRLHCSQNDGMLYIPEIVSSFSSDHSNTGSHFGYLEDDVQQQQKCYEQVVSEYLKHIGAYVQAPFKSVDFEEEFSSEATVIIPVKNRVKTLKDAIESVLSQATSFEFNLIIIDNHSTDGTTELIDTYKADPRVIHHIPERNDLGIGGCWNEGINHPQCGRFSIQLDSDDIYKDETTLQQVVSCFHTKKAAMVIGSYQLVDFDLNELPPGLIDHKEWTDDNGPNNALRINGLGAPRAFYTPIIRSIQFPNVSYGEDYAVAIRIAAEYKVGRIYNSLYLCRRWNDNTDANIDLTKKNKFNTYKDWLRTIELERRILENGKDK